MVAELFLTLKLLELPLVLPLVLELLQQGAALPAFVALAQLLATQTLMLLVLLLMELVAK